MQKFTAERTDGREIKRTRPIIYKRLVWKAYHAVSTEESILYRPLGPRVNNLSVVTRHQVGDNSKAPQKHFRDSSDHVSAG